MQLNYQELVYSYPLHLVPPCEDVVLCSGTIPNQCETPLLTFFFSSPKQHEEVQGGSMQWNYQELVYSYPLHLVPPCEDVVREGSV